jgi:hypothetical protein
MRIGWPGRARLSLARQSPLLHGRFPFQDEVGVQVLPGPPAIVAGQSAVGSEPGALAGCLGRAGAARPSPPARPSAPPAPSTPAAGATTTTQRGRPPPEDGSLVAGAATSRCGRRPCPTGAAADGRSARRPGLPGRPGSSAAAAHTRPGPARVRHRQPRRPCATSAASPASEPARPMTRAARRCGRPQGPGPVPRGAGCRSASACPQRHRLMGTRRTRPDGRGGHQRAGHQTGRTPDGRMPDPGRRT